VTECMIHCFLSYNSVTIKEVSLEFDVCVTVYHRYNNRKGQIDTTTINFINNFNQLNIFRTIISLGCLLFEDRYFLAMIYRHH